jgi:hypothetical protein
MVGSTAEREVSCIVPMLSDNCCDERTVEASAQKNCHRLIGCRKSLDHCISEDFADGVIYSKWLMLAHHINLASDSIN